MDYQSIANIANTIGVIVSTLTLYSAYKLYSIGKRDSYVKDIRNSLISYQNNSRNLNKLISFDITHELVSNVVYSRQIERSLKTIYNLYFRNNNTTVESLKTYLDEKFNAITVSIHTELLKQFDTILMTNSQYASKFYTDYPSMFRVYEAINWVFEATINISKSMVRDEEIFCDVIIGCYENDENIKDIEDFKDAIFYTYMSIIIDKHEDNDQADIDDALNLLKLTSTGMMRLTDKELIKQRNKERSIRYKEFDSTETVFDELLDAEKGLKLFLNESEMLLFREFCTRIKVRN